jgi:hypothetical protein
MNYNDFIADLVQGFKVPKCQFELTKHSHPAGAKIDLKKLTRFGKKCVRRIAPP